MTPPWRHRVAEALSPLSDIFTSLEAQSLTFVGQVSADASLVKIVLAFEDIALVIIANEADDSIDIAMQKLADSHYDACCDVSNAEPWISVLGKRFGWGWACVNQQGYLDGLLLSFDGVIPQIALNVTASSLKVGRVLWSVG